MALRLTDGAWSQALLQGRDAVVETLRPVDHVAIENAPLDKFDDIEQKWIRRMIRLANILGVDAEHKEHLDFLEDWASQEHS